jgi:hypothetical protein
MTQEAHQKYLAARRATCDRIAARAAHYKVCEHCKSISTLGPAICEICHAYCWLEGEDIVKAVAGEMRLNPFPVTLGYPQRLGRPVVGIGYLGHYR